MSATTRGQARRIDPRRELEALSRDNQEASEDEILDLFSERIRTDKALRDAFIKEAAGKWLEEIRDDQAEDGEAAAVNNAEGAG